MTTLPNDHTVRNDMNFGAIIGRADLCDEVVVDAVKNRLASKNRTEDDAGALLSAAIAGDGEAISFLRTIQVPAPTVRLAMPMQPLTRERRGFALPSIRFSWNRG
ncbi:hypothetical protein [Jiella pelagia]|uniref:Uncharacterized protein n=1 Tax=Jiella pelagia TaxID=2986949 RepID=A0ABY7BWY1_9HYPH|nr:hypothetical protein [Jiella pelagia]WAP67461.1 hypothetical protein OH818_18300 [Jiella pelagia]